MCNVCGKDLQYSLPRLFFIFPISVVHSPLFLHSLLLPQPLGWSFFVPVSLLNCCSSSLLPGDHLDPWRGQTLPRDSPETEAMHSSSITFPPPSTPPSPLYSFIHVPVSFHSCSVSPLRPPHPSPHFLALSYSFITGETPQWTSICTTHPLHIYSILTATFKAACSIQYIFSASISQYIKYWKVTLWSK